MKKLSLIMAVVMCTSLIAVQASDAGSKQSYRWEGVAIGLGAAVLGNVLLNQCNPHSRPFYGPPEYPPKHHRSRKVWVPPQFERTWNPGHYDRHGMWRSGEWITIKIQSGYWKLKRRWD